MMKQLNTTLLAVILGLFLTPVLTTAQQSSDKSHADHMGKSDKKDQHKPDSMTLSSSDRDFIMKAAEGGTMEVALGQMAVGKASSADVKNFAQRMVDDHSKAGQELSALAASKGLTLPAPDAQKEQKMKAQFDKYSGADFDREYMKAMVKDHDHDVPMFEHHSKSGRDADLKALIDKTLPTLREHQQMAHDIAGKIGATNAAMKEKKGKMAEKPNKD